MPNAALPGTPAAVRTKLLASVCRRDVLLDGMLRPLDFLNAETSMTIARRLPTLGLVVAIVVGFAGCSDAKKVSSARDSGADSAVGPPPPGPDATTVHHPDASVAKCGGFGRVAACTACLEKNCCDIGTACAKNSDCANAVECVRPCDGKPPSCGQACLTGLAGTQYNPLVTCMYGSCQKECPFASP